MVKVWNRFAIQVLHGLRERECLVARKNRSAMTNEREPTPGDPRRLVVVFPGQGSQFVGMGRELSARFAVAREAFDEASEALGYDLGRLCREGPEAELAQTVRAQPAILTCSVAAWRVFQRECGRTPTLGAGHSLGEFSALTCAGALALADAVRLVEARGRFMQEAAPFGSGAMAVVFGPPPGEVAAACEAASTPGELAAVANVNSPEQSVVSGSAVAVRRACQALSAAGAVTQEMKISIPAHSPLMAPAAERLASALAPLPLADAAWPVLANATAEPYGRAAAVRELLVRQLTRPVPWHSIATLLAAHAPEAVVELGPRAALRDLFKAAFPLTPCFAAGEPTGLEAACRFLARPTAASPAPPWEPFLARCLVIAVATRNRTESPERHELAVAEPYRRLQALRRAQGERGGPPTREQVRQGAELLRRLLRSKKVPLEERARRFGRLFQQTDTAALFPDFDP